MFRLLYILFICLRVVFRLQAVVAGDVAKARGAGGRVMALLRQEDVRLKEEAAAALQQPPQVSKTSSTLSPPTFICFRCHHTIVGTTVINNSHNNGLWSRPIFSVPLTANIVHWPQYSRVLPGVSS